MEMIKSIVKQYYQVLIILGGVSFVIWIFFSGGLDHKENIFKGIGEWYGPLVDSGGVKSDGIDYIESADTGDVPIVKYNAGTQLVGTGVGFKDMFLVEKEDGTIVNGSLEDGFAIYLMDICNQSGTSVIKMLETEERETMIEDVAPITYDKERDILYFHKSGIFVVYIKVYGGNGERELYECHIPVEAG